MDKRREMTKKQLAFTVAIVLFATFVAISPIFSRVFAWSNGGYSTDPALPVYGTHDWIAQHALDWLPAQEKQFFTDNLASYLYGTELPDNKNTLDGIGDTTKHHIYFFVNGSLQDDAAAVRTKQEYANAQASLTAGNISAAAEHLGMVAHYVSDIAVFGHVMGASTAWGTETHHSDYEDHVRAKTENYSSEFTSYLVFDGNLTTTSAYDATLAVARDTTFGGASGLTCTWMAQHYNWSSSQFKSRFGESLNVAGNAVADVLHTFYAETLAPSPTTSQALNATPATTQTPTPTPNATQTWPPPSPTATPATTLTPKPTATSQVPEFPTQPLLLATFAILAVASLCIVALYKRRFAKP